LFSPTLPKNILKAHFTKHVLKFKKPAGTSRGYLKEKPVWYVVLSKDGKKGIGECSPIWGLSPESPKDYETKLTELCNSINNSGTIPQISTEQYPSISFGFEMAHRSLQNNSSFLLFDNEFSQGTSGIM